MLIAVVLTLGAIGSTGIYAARNVQEREAADRKADEQAKWANRPILNATCRMNGYGDGECDFTNTGKMSGAMCGYIRVDDKEDTWTKTYSGYAVSAKTLLRSETLCSGQVPPFTTKTTRFSVNRYLETCGEKQCRWAFYQGVLNS